MMTSHSDYIEPFSFSSRWIKWKDIERCPYTFREPEYTEWSRKYEERLSLAALDNYAEYLRTRHAHNENMQLP